MSAEPAHARFWELWQSNQDSLLQQSLRLTRGNRDDARELLSTAMLRAAGKFPAHAPHIRNAKAWFHRVLQNVHRDGIRERQHFVSDNLIPDEEHEERICLPDDRPSPEELLLRRERLRDMWRQVRALPEALRAPVVLRFCEDVSYPEIAERLALTRCNARKRVQLACARVRHTLVSD